MECGGCDPWMLSDGFIPGCRDVHCPIFSSVSVRYGFLVRQYRSIHTDICSRYRETQSAFRDIARLGKISLVSLREYRYRSDIFDKPRLGRCTSLLHVHSTLQHRPKPASYNRDRMSSDRFCAWFFVIAALEKSPRSRRSPLNTPEV